MASTIVIMVSISVDEGTLDAEYGDMHHESMHWHH